jgi:hypothetical protein
MLAMTKSATVFVNYIASRYAEPLSLFKFINPSRGLLLIRSPSGNEIAHGEGRKTLASRDIFSALRDLEFPDWEDQLQAELDSKILGCLYAPFDINYFQNTPRSRATSEITTARRSQTAKLALQRVRKRGKGKMAIMI